MADLLDQIVSSKGVVGKKPAVSPRIDKRLLVKRMLVRRPLLNALKEEECTGRPLMLFLPDVSPSCSHIASYSCDLASAASLAGCVGSDVAVWAHANGNVEPLSVAQPMLNGEFFTGIGNYLIAGATTTNMHSEGMYTATDALFKNFCLGNTKYKAKVVVAIGDHDAVDLYLDIMREAKHVRAFIWLHTNRSQDNEIALVEPERFLGRHGPLPSRLHPIFIEGCCNDKKLFPGLRLAIKKLNTLS